MAAPITPYEAAIFIRKHGPYAAEAFYPYVLLAVGFYVILTFFWTFMLVSRVYSIYVEMPSHGLDPHTIFPYLGLDWWGWSFYGYKIAAGVCWALILYAISLILVDVGRHKLELEEEQPITDEKETT